MGGWETLVLKMDLHLLQHSTIWRYNILLFSKILIGMTETVTFEYLRYGIRPLFLYRLGQNARIRKVVTKISTVPLHSVPTNERSEKRFKMLVSFQTERRLIIFVDSVHHGFVARAKHVMFHAFRPSDSIQILLGSFSVLNITRGADKSLARPTSRCHRTEWIVSLERGVCSCYRGWKEACHALRAISTTSKRELSSSFSFQ
jgi:hypothetical protein